MRTLNKLKIDEEGIVKENIKDNRRLRDLGLVKGTKVKCVLNCRHKGRRRFRSVGGGALQ